MDSLTIKVQASQLFELAGSLPRREDAAELRYWADVLLAQAEHLDRTGHYIELPRHMLDVTLLLEQAAFE
jgi:hypothetical protein